MDATPAGGTPEELESLMEDAVVLRDAAALSGLFEPGGVLVAGAVCELRGRGAIAKAVETTTALGGGYLAHPRRLYQSGDLVLLLGNGVINVARRGADRTWRFAISLIDPELRAPNSFAKRPFDWARTLPRKEEAMHTMVVRMSSDPARRDELQKHFEEDVLPWAKRQQGFVSGQWLCAPGGDEALGVVVFESAEAADTAARDPRDYGRHERDLARAWNIEDVTVFEQVVQS